jgi:hypothetical protein
MTIQKPGIKLRGHHLICLHFFKGEGYNAKFVENLREILERTEKGEEIEVHAGPDDICRQCPYLQNHVCVYKADSELEIREMDTTATELLGIENNDTVSWFYIKKKIPAIFYVWSSRYCRECDWRRACENNNEFKELSKKQLNAY